MIPFAMPVPPIDGGDHSAGFFGFQIDSRSAQSSFVADGEDTTVLTGSRHILPQQMLHKAPNSRKAAIAGNGGVSARRFNMVQKREHGVGLNIFEHEIRHGLSLLIRQKHKEEPSARRDKPARYDRSLRVCSAGTCGRSFQSASGVTRILSGSCVVVLAHGLVSAAQPVDSPLQEFRSRMQVSLCADNVDVSHVRRQPRQAGMEVHAPAIPPAQPLDCESMPQIIRSRPAPALSGFKPARLNS